MPFAIRVKLDPRPRPGADGAALVRGVGIGLASVAGGESGAVVGTAKPAELKFQARFLKDARGNEATEVVDVGMIRGSIAFRGSTPVFTIDGTPSVGTAPGDAAATSELRRPRELELTFDGRAFSGPAATARGARMFLPDPPSNEFRHLELLVELAIAGASEAEAEKNDILDLGVVPRQLLAVNVVDEVGEPISGEPIEVRFGSEIVRLTTGADGRVFIENPPAPSAMLRIVDPKALQAKLKPRWERPRTGRRLLPTAGVRVVFLPGADDELPVSRALTVSVQPRVVRAGLVGLFFDTSKTFLLPDAMDGIRGIKQLYDQNPSSKVLVVGHTDRAGNASYNDTLSLDRADAIAAFLTDQVDGWFKWYGAAVPAEKRWGAHEDQQMLSALPDAVEVLTAEDPIRRFQATRGLPETGTMDDVTRKALIRDYMSLDGTSLPAGVELVTHGCGENFPDVVTPDGEPNPENRRVELFFFDRELGIQPPPAGKNSRAGSLEYPEWRRRARVNEIFTVGNRNRRLRLRLLVNGEPIANEDVQVFVDGVFQGAGQTDADGIVERAITENAREALVRVQKVGIERLVELGPVETFPPAGELRGAQIRLHHLGFYVGVIDGAPGPIMDAAVREFKLSRGLTADSALDTPAIDALVEAYGA